MRRAIPALAGLTLLAAGLRFATVGAQSFWYDEAVTAELVEKGFRGMLRAIPDSESTPPLYYVLAWGWAKLFGTGEAGLRTLSALLGTLTVPVAFLAARRLVSERAGVAAAALVAVSPLLVWYSQEARAYALLVLLGGVTLWLFARARDGGTARDFAWWGITAVLALATHYFAAFLILPEAALLLWDPRTRRLATAACGGIAVAGLALLPLAVDQASNGGAGFIGSSSLLGRIARAPKQFLLGYDSPAETILAIAAGLLVLLALYLLVTRGDEDEKRGALTSAGIAAAALAVPLVLAVAGIDFFLARNVIAAWLPAAFVAAAGFGVRRAGQAGPIALIALCGICAFTIAAVASDERYQRDDWKDAAADLGPVSVPRALVVTPASGRVPMEHYLHGASPLGPEGARVQEVDLIGLAQRRPDESAKPPRQAARAELDFGFKQVERIETPTYTIVRYRAPKPATWLPPGLEFNRLSPMPAAVLQQR